jgi:hypothetical protein
MPRVLRRIFSTTGPVVSEGLVVAASVEPSGRRLPRIGFGVLWLLDGILQAQPNMAAGLPSQVIEPTAGASPPWVQDVVHWGQAAWTGHPVEVGSAAVWIQIGLGLWLLLAPRGELSRLAGLAGAGWGLIVWVFGESFGGLFAPGLTWPTGAPGAVLVYVAAGAVIALPDRAWRSPRLGRLTLGGLGLVLAVMAGVQAQPSLGFWQRVSYGQPAPLAAMIQSMSHTPQSGFLSGWIAAFGAFDEAHGFAVNLVVVTALVCCGAAFLSGRPRLIRPALGLFAVLCLADWVLIQDLGFLGGLATDPNSMIPFVLLAAGGYLALTRSESLTRDVAASTRQVHHDPISSSLLPQKAFRRVAMEMWGHPRITNRAGRCPLGRLSSVKIGKLRTVI